MPIQDTVAVAETKARYPNCVLCVEDDKDILRLVQLSLERIGRMRAHTCSDPRLAIAQARGVRPDLIVLDLKMPELNGRELFQLLKADPDLRQIPVAFLTANTGAAEVAALHELGAAGVFLKPFDTGLAEQLVDAWRRATSGDF